MSEEERIAAMVERGDVAELSAEIRRLRGLFRQLEVSLRDERENRPDETRIAICRQALPDESDLPHVMDIVGIWGRD